TMFASSKEKMYRENYQQLLKQLLIANENIGSLKAENKYLSSRVVDQEVEISRLDSTVKSLEALQENIISAGKKLGINLSDFISGCDLDVFFFDGIDLAAKETREALKSVVIPNFEDCTESGQVNRERYEYTRLRATRLLGV